VWREETMLTGFARLRAEALKDNAPALYRQLRASGQLEKHCNQAAPHVVNSVMQAKEKGLNLAVAQSDAERELIYEIPELPTEEL
jgi:hypothetical protein